MKQPPFKMLRNSGKRYGVKKKDAIKDQSGLKHAQEMNENKQQQDWIEISKEELEAAMRKSHKWKSPGIDKIPNVWLHAVAEGHLKLATLLSDIVEIPGKAPKWLSEGVTYHLLKTKDTKNHKTYRPTTCQSTTNKICTSVLSERTYTYMETNEAFPFEQKGCNRGSYGCKDQLVINKMIIEHCKSKHRNLSMTWK